MTTRKNGETLTLIKLKPVKVPENKNATGAGDGEKKNSFPTTHNRFRDMKGGSSPSGTKVKKKYGTAATDSGGKTY